MPVELADLKELLFAMENRLEKRFDAIDKRFEEMETRFEARFQDIDQRFREIDHRFQAIDHRFREIDQRFDEMDTRFMERMDQLEQSLLGKMDVIAKQTQQNSLDIHHLSLLMTATDRQLKVHSVQLTKLTTYVETKQNQASKRAKKSRKAHRFTVIHAPHLKPRSEE